MPKDAQNGKQEKRRSRSRDLPSAYVQSVLRLYTDLPYTPNRPSRDDRFVVQRLQLQRVPLLRVQAALLLATARRLFRVDSSDPLFPIRSIRYFLPVVDELASESFDAAYVQYLCRKLEVSIKSVPGDDEDSVGPARRPPSKQLPLPW